MTVLPLPSAEEVAAAQGSLAGGSRPCAAMAMMFGTAQGRQTGGYRASLTARVQLRLGMWRWSITPAEVGVPGHHRVLEARTLCTGEESLESLPLLYCYRAGGV